MSTVFLQGEGETKDFKRPQLSGVQVPPGTFKIDGFEKDWNRLGKKLLSETKIESSVKQKLLWKRNQSNFSRYRGNSDLSVVVQTAVDNEAFYILAKVRDQLSFNTQVGQKSIFSGDDFEIFIDANVGKNRYSSERSTNFAQVIIAPAFSDVGQSKPQVDTYFYHEAETAEVEVATRKHLWGYTIEVRFPKANLPAWKARPNQASIGFGVEVHDADDAGMLHFKGNLRAIRWLSHAHPHHQAPHYLSELKFDRKLKKLRGKAPPNRKQNSDEALAASVKAAASAGKANETAQRLLDSIDEQKIDLAVNEALMSDEKLIVSAGAFIAARRSDIELKPEVIEAILARLNEPRKKRELLSSNYKLYSYLFFALAERKKLPVKTLFPLYGRYVDTEFNDSALRINFLGAVVKHGDVSIAPSFVHLLYDGDPQIRQMAIFALRSLNYRKAFDELKEIKQNDPFAEVRAEAAKALKAEEEKRFALVKEM